MTSKEKIKTCFKGGEAGGEKHKGLKKIKISDSRVDGHVKKAGRNFH